MTEEAQPWIRAWMSAYPPCDPYEVVGRLAAQIRDSEFLPDSTPMTTYGATRPREKIGPPELLQLFPPGPVPVVIIEFWESDRPVGISNHTDTEQVGGP